MKKRFCLFALTAALLVGGMTACGNSDENGGEESQIESISETAASESESPKENTSDTETDTAALPNEEVAYSVTIRAASGAFFNRLNFVVMKGDQMLKHNMTDTEGKATISLPADDGYSIKIITALPDGYLVEDSYPLTGTETEIRIPSAVIPDSDLTGVNYRLGDIMHDFTVTTVDGETLTLSDILAEKKAVMLNFWFINCNPCQSEFPHMQAAYAAQNGVEVIAMNDVVGESEEEIKTFKDDAGLTFPVVKETSGIGQAIGVTAYPTTVFIDRYGMICFEHSGGLSEEQFAKAFAYFSAEDYTQVLFDSIDEIPEVN